MVQEFNVLRCFSCKRFQVHQVKKASNWICKVCGEKQSISRIYGKGRAPDCRRHVQKLNTIQGEREQLIAEKVIDADDDEEFDCFEDEVIDTEKLEQENLSNERDQVGSKWEKFIETDKKNEENLEEELWNGIPVTMDKKAFDDGTKNAKHPKNLKKNTPSNEELSPQKKRVKTQDFENDEDEFQHGHYSKRNSQKVKELKDKSKSKWEIFNSNSEEILPNEKLVPFNKHDGKSTSKSKSFDMVKLNDSTVKHLPCNSKNLASKSVNSQAKSKGAPCKSNIKTSQSKWSKFLGSSNCAHEEKEEEEEEEVEGENVGIYSNLVASENNLKKKKLLTTAGPTCNNTMDSNTLESICNISNPLSVNASGIPIPSFLMNATATRSGQKAGESTNSCQSSQEPSSISSNTLFTIDDDLGDEWWNV